jgi:selenoprotein W-related protein
VSPGAVSSLRSGQRESPPGHPGVVVTNLNFMRSILRSPVRGGTRNRLPPVRTPRLEIEYCTQCRWLLRAAWTAQELLTTFQLELGEVALVPGTGGVFEIRLDDELLWSRKASGFPELAELKRLVRDRVAPDRDLGHSDRR